MANPSRPLDPYATPDWQQGTIRLGDGNTISYGVGSISSGPERVVVSQLSFDEAALHLADLPLGGRSELRETEYREEQLSRLHHDMMESATRLPKPAEQAMYPVRQQLAVLRELVKCWRQTEQSRRSVGVLDLEYPLTVFQGLLASLENAVQVAADELVERVHIWQHSLGIETEHQEAAGGSTFRGAMESFLGEYLLKNDKPEGDF